MFENQCQSVLGNQHYYKKIATIYLVCRLSGRIDKKLMLMDKKEY